MTQLTIRLLGPPQIAVDGAPIQVDTRKAIALLAYLVLAERPQQRSTLAALLWPESDDARARSVLRRTLAALNGAIGKRWLAADRATIGLDPAVLADGSLWADVVEFRRAWRSGSDGPCAAALPHLMAAADLVRGPFMQGFTLGDSAEFDDWQQQEAEALTVQVSRLYERVVHCWREAGDVDQALAQARRWVALDPLQEPAQRALMQLLAESGQRAVALRHFDELTRLLDDELGIDPAAETVTLRDAIADGRVAPATAPRHNLPQHLSALVGRREELAAVEALLARPDCRLVTVLGQGGVGKTRLALEVAQQALPRYAQGVYFVALAAVDSAEYLDRTIAQTLGYEFYGRGDAADQLINYLRGKEMLLVLDNFEHLLDGAPLLSRILSQAARVRLLVTSQERLNLHEEWLIELKGLPVPANGALEQSSAFRLFVERARQVQPHFAVSAADRGAVATICRLVSGLPLGIELAATWVRVLAPDDIARQIEASLDFLSTSVRNVPARHRSLRAVFEHSWQLLDSAEQTTLSRLAVFRGGFTPAAALAVTGAGLPVLMALVDKSLLQSDATGRFDIPAVLRLYLREKGIDNDEAQRIEQRFADHFADFLAARTSALKGERQKAALLEIGAEIENVRHAWALMARHGRTDALDRALESVHIFYQIHSWFGEGASAMQAALAQLGAPVDQAGQRLTGRLLAGEGAFLVRAARMGPGRERLEQALTQLRAVNAPSSTALALRYLGIIAETEGNYPAAVAYFDESLALCTAAADRWGMANALTALGNLHLLRGDDATAERAYRDSLRIREATGDWRGLSLCYHNLGHIAHQREAYDEALALYRESVALKREVGMRRGVAYSLNNMGHIAYRRGLHDEALTYLAESLEILVEVGDRRGEAYARTNLGNVALARGDSAEARRHYTQSHTVFDAIGDRVGVAFSLEDLGQVALRQGELGPARAHFLGALREAQAVGATPVLLDAVAGLAQLAAAGGEPDHAAELAAVALAHPQLNNQTRDTLQALADEWPVAPAPPPLEAVVQRLLAVA